MVVCLSIVIVFQIQCQKVATQPDEKFFLSTVIKTDRVQSEVFGQISGKFLKYYADSAGKNSIPFESIGKHQITFGAPCYMDTSIQIDFFENENIDLDTIWLTSVMHDLFGSIDVDGNSPYDYLFIETYRSLNDTIIDSFYFSSDTLSFSFWISDYREKYNEETFDLIVNDKKRSITTRKEQALFNVALDTGRNVIKFVTKKYKPRQIIAHNIRHEQRYVTIVSHSREMDLHLVNEQGDTRNYRHIQPKWGDISKIDDPYLTIKNVGYEEQNVIQIPKMADGKYTVLVHNYCDTTSYRGVGNNAANISIHYNDITLIKVSSKNQLKANELWVAGEIRVPEMTFTPIDSYKVVYYP